MNEGCGKLLAPGQYWSECGETDMGQSAPVLCTECGGNLKLSGHDDSIKSTSALLSTTDAQVWAKEFIKCKEKNNWTLEDIDEGLMIGWFANAFLAQEMKDNSKHSAGKEKICER